MQGTITLNALHAKRPVGRPRKEIPPEPEAPPRNPEKEFLVGFLAGGPIARTNVYRESENNHLEWEAVRIAFNELNGREYFQKGTPFWRIMPD